jgi:hypothetical protein
MSSASWAEPTMRKATLNKSRLWPMTSALEVLFTTMRSGV